MHNTIDSIWKGMTMWSDQGIFFETETKPEHVVLDEKKSLEHFYGLPITETLLIDEAKSSKKYHLKRTKGKDQEQIKIIVNRCEELGKDYKTIRKGADEECERQMEREIEVEEEEVLEYSKMYPREEIDWEIETVFHSKSVEDLPAS